VPVRYRALTTDRRYAATVGELLDRRARKKAQTRELIRSVARRLFDEHGFEAVTIADVARESDVAVQTVFNHFATKEELFFDGREPWVDGPAQAVRLRGPAVAPLTALRTHFVQLVSERLGSLRSPDRRRYVATLEASDGLRAHERELMHQAEQRLRAALLEAWATDDRAPADPESAAPLIAAIWVAAGRALIVGQRPQVTDEGADPEVIAAAAMDVADRVLRQLEIGGLALNRTTGTSEFSDAASHADTGWPQSVRRAG
jgi:AcrR family transcriptional regulator